MIRTRSGPRIPVEFFEDFTLTGDERYISLWCKKCKKECLEVEWWGNNNWDFSVNPRDISPLMKFLMAAGDHECRKPVSPAEDSSMTNAEIQEIKDAAVATGKYRMKDSSQSKENPYANIEKNGGSLTMTVVPKNNVL